MHLLDNAIACPYVRVAVRGCSCQERIFAYRWTYNGKTVCWVSQLVVHSDCRQRELAVCLLNQLRQDGDES